MNALAQLQHWMLASIANPDGIAGAEPVRPSATLTSEERLAIYNRAYFARLMQNLQSTFPALRQALGDELFNRFAFGYLAAHPPSGPSLETLADHFPRYLEETSPQTDETWIQFVIELARIEFAFAKVYCGEGIEGRATSPLDVLALAPDALLALTLTPAPSLRLFSCTHPVHDYLAAVRNEEKPDLPPPRTSHFAISRIHYRVFVHELSLGEHAILASLDGTRALSAAAPQRDLQMLSLWVADWARKCFVTF
ncbi:MAG TPA: DNA-binding domain-containing protein [Thermoanaerobaculia bacterium]